MNRKRSQLQAYFAGIFDGEGCIGFNGSNRNSLSVVIGMTDPQALGLLWREYPKGHLYLRPNAQTPWRPCFIFRLNHHYAYDFLRDTLPFVMVKREQAKVALAYLAHRRREHYTGRQFKGRPGCVGYDCHGRCDRLIARLSELKRVGYQGVNSANLLDLGDLREYRAKPEDVAEDQRLISAELQRLWEGVETRDRAATPVEPISAPEKEIVHPVAA